MKFEHPPKQIGTDHHELNLVSKDLPREFIRIVVRCLPGTPEWNQMLNSDVVYPAFGNVSYSRKYWAW